MKWSTNRWNNFWYDRRAKKYTWRYWFAWYPVNISEPESVKEGHIIKYFHLTNKYVWLETILRKKYDHGNREGKDYWIYVEQTQ